ncbi:hypothetical protein HI914_02988 [Erysiphe necator]|nr:hypothetical protein HI914_02988 [Erysiphe necator]
MLLNRCKFNMSLYSSSRPQYNTFYHRCKTSTNVPFFLPTNTSPISIGCVRSKATTICQNYDENFRKRRKNNRSNKDQKRFWDKVHVREVDNGLQIYLDNRPLRRSNSKTLTIPSTKPHLATAIASEWDFLESTRNALKPHLTPLTSLVSRALDIIESDIADKTNNINSGAIRDTIVESLLRYLDTDSILCWVPTPYEIPSYENHVSRIEPLRNIQQQSAQPIIDFLEKKLWPGANLNPSLDEYSIIPITQSPETRQIIRNWVYGLNAFNLAALERGTLAGKGILVAARLVAEWGEDFRHLFGNDHEMNKFGIEEAAIAASLESEWQIKMWGLVEDTHDVEREDLRRQFGSVVLLVSGS